MVKMPLEEYVADSSVAEIKEMIFSLTKQIFPLLDANEKQTFVKKLIGKTGDDKISSMASL